MGCAVSELVRPSTRHKKSFLDAMSEFTHSDQAMVFERRLAKGDF